MSSHFTVLLSGQIESAMFPEHNDLYCKFAFRQGQDWTVISGTEEGISQQSRKQSLLLAGSNCLTNGSHSTPTIVWNFPLEVAFRSTNAFGWPQLILSVYGPDTLGRDVVRGYGWVHVPMVPGRHTLYVPVYVPMASSVLNGWLSAAAGKLPEFLDPKFVAKCEGREGVFFFDETSPSHPVVTRVQSQGIIKVVVHLVTKDMEKYGYHSGSLRQA